MFTNKLLTQAFTYKLHLIKTDVLSIQDQNTFKDTKRRTVTFLFYQTREKIVFCKKSLPISGNIRQSRKRNKKIL